MQATEPGGGFQTARAKLAAELRAKGQQYVPPRPPPGAEPPVLRPGGGGGMQGPAGAARLATRAVLAGRGSGSGAAGGSSV